jgi:hypothetical protein
VTAGLGSALPAGAHAVQGGDDEVANAWWLVTPALLGEVEQRARASRTAMAFQLGDAVLELETNEPLLVEAFGHLYADCATTSGAVGPDVPVVRCTVWRSTAPELVVLRFLEGGPPDPAGAAYHLLRPTQAVSPYRVWDAPVPGWRLAGGATGPVLAAHDAEVLLHPKLIPPAFLVEYLVSVVLGAQTWILPVHGATVQIGEAAAMLVGASRAGKTTMALHLASRGHPLLGDEIALIRLATREVVPFRRSVNVRPGPHADELAGALGLSGGRNGSPWEAPERAIHRITALFPGRPARPTRLRAAFFLAGFADQPAREAFQLTLDREDVIGWITTPEIAYCSWGLAPARRAFRLMVLRQALSQTPSWLLKVGRPGDTAALIERTMEELAC